MTSTICGCGPLWIRRERVLDFTLLLRLSSWYSELDEPLLTFRRGRGGSGFLATSCNAFSSSIGDIGDTVLFGADPEFLRTLRGGGQSSKLSFEI